MPTYEYECDGCGHTFEMFQRIVEDPISKCPECHKKKLRRLFGTGAAVVFKGSGFYQTDYRSESYKKGAKDADKKPDDKKEGKSEKGSESKSEKGSESKSDSTASETSTTKSSSKPKNDST